jgi:hypothetical protein
MLTKVFGVPRCRVYQPIATTSPSSARITSRVRTATRTNAPSGTAPSRPSCLVIGSPRIVRTGGGPHTAPSTPKRNSGALAEANLRGRTYSHALIRGSRGGVCSGEFDRPAKAYVSYTASGEMVVRGRPLPLPNGQHRARMMEPDPDLEGLPPIAGTVASSNVPVRLWPPGPRLVSHHAALRL